MKLDSKTLRLGVILLFSCLPISGAFAAGGADGGGGYQYPNSKRLLKIVSEPLAKEIEKMDDKAFANFPSNLRRKELAAIIRHVVPAPDVYRERPNDLGDNEGLMFDLLFLSTLLGDSLIHLGG